MLFTNFFLLVLPYLIRLERVLILGRKMAYREERPTRDLLNRTNKVKDCQAEFMWELRVVAISFSIKKKTFLNRH